MLVPCLRGIGDGGCIEHLSNHEKDGYDAEDVDGVSYAPRVDQRSVLFYKRHTVN